MQAGAPGHALILAGDGYLAGGASPLTSNCRSTSSSSSLSSISNGIMAAAQTPVPHICTPSGGAATLVQTSSVGFKRQALHHSPSAVTAIRTSRWVLVLVLSSHREVAQSTPTPSFARATAGLHKHASQR